MAQQNAGLEKLKLMLSGLKDGIQNIDLTMTLDVIRNDIEEDTAGYFADAHDPQGNHWPAFAHGGGQSHLIQSGDLLTAALASVRRAQIGPHSLRIPFHGPAYGVFHMVGTKYMPKRKWFGISTDRYDSIVGQIKITISQQVRESMRQQGGF